MLNSVVLVGYVGKDPRVRYYESGKVQAVFSLGVSRPLKRGAEADPVTDWFSIELWGKRAELAGSYVRKGALLGVEGRLEFRSDTDERGQPYTIPYIAAYDFRFLGPKADSLAAQQAAAETTR